MVAELLVYADESGYHETAEYCVVAGYIGSPRQWKLFNSNWAEILARYSVSELHTKDFFGRRHKSPSSPYYGWTGGKSHKFLKELTEAIHARRLDPIGETVRVSDFMAFSEGERQYLTHARIDSAGKVDRMGAPTRPYQWALGGLLVEAAERTPAGMKVHFTLDNHETEEPQTHASFSRFIENSEDKWRSKLGRLSYAFRGDEPGLQAADLLAHLWYSYHTNDRDMGSENMSAMSVLAKKRSQLNWSDASTLEMALSTLSPQQREALRSR